jgi:hypothetical protein
MHPVIHLLWTYIMVGVMFCTPLYTFIHLYTPFVEIYHGRCNVLYLQKVTHIHKYIAPIEVYVYRPYHVHGCA